MGLTVLELVENVLAPLPNAQSTSRPSSLFIMIIVPDVFLVCVFFFVVVVVVVVVVVL